MCYVGSCSSSKSLNACWRAGVGEGISVGQLNGCRVLSNCLNKKSLQNCCAVDMLA